MRHLIGRRIDGCEAASTHHSTVINAWPEHVYDLVADIELMANLSPECDGCWWIDGATGAVEGARFRGRGCRGRRRWTTTSEIVEAVPGRRISWNVTYLTCPVAHWSYEFLDLGDGRTAVTERCVDQRGPVLRRLSAWITGTKDRSARNAETMDVTLDRLKAVAEAEEPSPR